MIENDRQYLVTLRQMHGFAREVERLGAARGRTPEQALLDDAGLRAAQSVRDELRAGLEDYDRRTAADRKGSWMPTFTGRRFWLLDPRPGDVELEDIAQGLSRMSRYNGMTAGDVGYTVAQHSVMASHLVREEHRLAVLMHDASEAYAGDVISPLKRLLGEAYEGIELGIMNAVAARFGFAWEDRAVQQSVKFADEVMLVTETRDLLPFRVLRLPPKHEPLPFEIRPWTQAVSKVRFLERFHELCPGA